MINEKILNYVIDGSISLENNDYIEALNNYKEVLKTTNDYNLLATYKSGVCFMKLKEYDKAIYFFNEVLKVNPFHRKTLLKLSYCYMQSHDIKDMIKTCDVIYDLDNRLSLQAI